jgi:hypothetical protein
MTIPCTRSDGITVRHAMLLAVLAYDPERLSVRPPWVVMVPEPEDMAVTATASLSHPFRFGQHPMALRTFGFIQTLTSANIAQESHP